MKTIDTVGDLKRGSFPQFVALLEAVGLRDEMTYAELRAWWTPARAVELARLDGQGSRLGAVHSIDCMLGTAVLEGADLRGVDLRGACLDRVWAHGVNLRGADLRGASMCRAVLYEADMRECRLNGANFDSADVAGALFDRADLRGANFVLAHVEWASVDGARGAHFEGAHGRPLSTPWAP